MKNYTIAFDPFLSHWLLGAFATIAIILFIFSFRVNFLKASLRFWFAALLLLFLAQPQLVKENRKSLNDVALIAIDKSLSGDFGKRKEVSDRALTHLRAELQKLSGLEIRTVDVAINAADETKVFDSIESIMADVPESQRAGTILITDGQVTDKASGEFLKSSPFHVILTGSRKDKDREIKILNAPGYSLLGETVSLKFIVEDHNISSGKIVTVTLNAPDGTTENRQVPVGETQNWPLTINSAGQNIFELSVEPVDKEISLLNNRAMINIQGIRNRLHVLLVSGEPYPGARMWRDLLKADPGIDLVHFTILRSPDKIDMTPPSELSLIAFPFQELFERKLKNFDLIIMDRFSLNTSLPDYYFQNMRNYVENGGALLEISGPSYATSSSMYNTSLGAILPGAPNGMMMQSSFKPKITNLGKSHPVTMPLTQSPEWGSWLQQLPVTRMSGDVLMTGIDNNPLLILAHTGKGRVAQMTSDQMWLWARGFQGGGPTTELLRRIVHWLMKEPELDENAFNIKVDGSDINIRTRKMDNLSQIEVTKPDGSKENIPFTTDEDGWLSANLKNNKHGIYKFNDGSRQKIISIGDTTTPEFSNIVTTDQNLLPLVTASKGGLIWAEEHPDFRIQNAGSNVRSGGSDWLGMKRNNSSSVVSSEMKPILPPEIMIIFALLAGFFLWWAESRNKLFTI